jgi:hypothetical protein
MNRFVFRFGLCAAMMSWFFLIPFSSNADQDAPLKVASALICKNVANREAVDADTSFAVSVGRLYCFSNIVDIQNSTEIVHAWYFGETERARVSLGINPPAWRTYSSKIIQSHEMGAWRVEILDGSGTLLETVRFEITQ